LQLAGRLQHRAVVRLVSLVAGAGVLWTACVTGCFYVDPVNRRPKISPVTRVCDGGDGSAPCDFADLHHGDAVKVRAEFSDPDSPPASSTVQWRILACDSTTKMCDGEALYEGPDATPSFVVRSTLHDFGGPVQVVVVDLDVFDDRGASSSESQPLMINDGPTLALSRAARTYTVGAPIDLFATYGDPDGAPLGSGPPAVDVSWMVISPDGPPAPLIDLDVPENLGDPTHVTLGKRLVPTEPGEWDVRVTATDAHAKPNAKDLRFTVASDQPPCLAQWQPIAPPAGASLPISEPTLFEVPLVADDLDPYPAVPGEPLLGTTVFEWSILAPGGGARQRLFGPSGNTIDFDPAAFTPGQIVELRVEIFDRLHTAVACPDAEPVCAASALPACNQRQTWRVEIR
jgi:hypothetical protein